MDAAAARGGGADAARRGETIRLLHPLFGDVDDVYGTGLPIRFSESDAGYDQPAPRMGQHNDAIYRDLLGYSPEHLGRVAWQQVQQREHADARQEDDRHRLDEASDDDATTARLLPQAARSIA